MYFAIHFEKHSIRKNNYKWLITLQCEITTKKRIISLNELLIDLYNVDIYMKIAFSIIVIITYMPTLINFQSETIIHTFFPFFALQNKIAFHSILSFHMCSVASNAIFDEMNQTVDYIFIPFIIKIPRKFNEKNSLEWTNTFCSSFRTYAKYMDKN